MSELSPRDTEDEEPLRDRIAANPRPAAIWAGVMGALLVVEAGALVHMFFEGLAIVLGGLPGEPAVALAESAMAAASEIPTLLSRELIPNQGYHDGSQWVGTFMGLSPGVSWAIRASLTTAYGFVFIWWLWRGYRVYRTHYRYADWTPRDDQFDRFSRHSWGKFGLVVVILFVIMAVFAPTLGPTTLEQNITSPYSHSVETWDAENQEVVEITAGEANIGSGSEGGSSNVGPMTYDDFGRFHPFGTLPSGKDLFTFMMYGSRLSMFIAMSSIVISGFIAAGLALATAYYKGLADLVTVVVSDSVQAIPVLMLAILIAVLFSDHWIAGLYNGGVLLVLLFSVVYWPFLWRAVRGPSFQVSEEDWVDAAKSFGQRPRTIMQKHMLPYIVGYLLIYGSMSLGGIIVSVAGLSYLGIGITPPTPEWGRAINLGQPYVATSSWHIALIPGLLITLVVTGLNALGDGIRDAIDPQSEGGTADEAAVGGGA
ncbi:MAG: ABC transporter permease [Halobacteriota archaeon]